MKTNRNQLVERLTRRVILEITDREVIGRLQKLMPGYTWDSTSRENWSGDDTSQTWTGRAKLNNDYMGALLAVVRVSRWQSPEQKGGWFRRGRAATETWSCSVDIERKGYGPEMAWTASRTLGAHGEAEGDSLDDVVAEAMNQFLMGLSEESREEQQALARKAANITQFLLSKD